MSIKERVMEELNKDKVMAVVSILTALFFSFSLVCGEALETEGELPIRSASAWISLVMTAVLCWCLLFSFLCWIRKRNTKDLAATAKPDSDLADKAKLTDRFWFVCGLFLLCWLPSFLAVYPGFFLYDAYDEYMEVATGLFTTHHPLLHVLLLGKTIENIHKLTGSFNYGIAFFIFVQMMVLAACFTYLLRCLKKANVEKSMRIMTFLYLAFFPVNTMFVLCSVKDTMFAAALLITVLLLRQYGDSIPTAFEQVLLGCALLFALLLRNNMLYALVVAVGLFLLYLCFVKGERSKKRAAFRKLLLFLLILLTFYEGISIGLVKHTHASKGGAQEILTVPIQQIARSYRANPDLFDEEEKALLFSYLPENALKRYTPNLSDPVKVSFENDVYKQNKKNFWRLWFKGLTHNPVGYVNAWCMTSYGFWYPSATINVYEGHSVFTHNYEKSSYFGFETEEPGVRDSKFPWLEKVYHDIALEGGVQRRPVLRLFFSMGALTFVYLLCMNVIIARKQYSKLLPYVLPTLVWLTFLLGPTFLPRYMVFQWFLLPLVLTDAFADIQKATILKEV